MLIGEAYVCGSLEMFSCDGNPFEYEADTWFTAML